jgi:hypothetical protein
VVFIGRGTNTQLHDDYIQNRSLTTNSPTLGNGRVKAKLASRVILFLQSLQTVLAPARASIQLLERFIAIGVVDISPEIIHTGTLTKNVTKLIAQIGDLRVQSGASGEIVDQRGGKDVLAAESESARVAGDCLHALHGVALEHEDGVVEGRVSADSVCEDIVCLRLRVDIV